MSKVGDRIRVLRIKRGFTQAQLAEKTGLRRSAIGNYENGIREPDLDTIELLADFFDVSIADLMGRDENENTDKAIYRKHSRGWRILSKGFDKMPEEDLNRIIKMLSAAYPEFFNEGDDENES